MKREYPAPTEAQRAIMAGDYSDAAVRRVAQELLAADPVRPGVYAINEARIRRDNFVDGTDGARFWDRVLEQLTPPAALIGAEAAAPEPFVVDDEATRALHVDDFSGAAAGQWVDAMLAARHSVPALDRARRYRDAAPISSQRAEFFRRVVTVLILRGAGAPTAAAAKPQPPQPSFDRDPEQGSLF